MQWVFLPVLLPLIGGLLQLVVRSFGLPAQRVLGLVLTGGLVALGIKMLSLAQAGDTLVRLSCDDLEVQQQRYRGELRVAKLRTRYSRQGSLDRAESAQHWSTLEAAEDAVATVVRELGPPRILVNCAGIAPAEQIVGRRQPIGLELFNRVVAVNLVGTFNLMRLAAHHMARLEPLDDEERGVIINTASVAAYEGQIGQAAYAASKGGVASLTLPAARELARRGIRVVAIAQACSRHRWC